MSKQLLTTIRLAALTTQDPVTRKLLLDTIGEDEHIATEELYSSKWSNVYSLEQDLEDIKTSLLKGILTSFKKSLSNKLE